MAGKRIIDLDPVTSLASTSVIAVYQGTEDDANGKACKMPISHASTSNIFGLGTTSNYGHVKLVDGLGSTAVVDGEALAAHQGSVIDERLTNVEGLIHDVASGYQPKSLNDIALLPYSDENSLAWKIHHNFDGIYPGDYITLDSRFPGSDGSTKLVVAHRIPHLTHTPALVMIPYNGFGKGKYHVNGACPGYAGSDIFNALDVIADDLCDTEIDGHKWLSTSRVVGGPSLQLVQLDGLKVSTSIDSSASNNLGDVQQLGASKSWAAIDTIENINHQPRDTVHYMSLMTEIQLFGSQIFSSSGFDSSGYYFDTQFEVFRNNPELMNAGVWGQSNMPFWLKNISSSNTACACDDGPTHHDMNLNQDIWLRPFFVVSFWQ